MSSSLYFLCLNHLLCIHGSGAGFCFCLRALAFKHGDGNRYGHRAGLAMDITSDIGCKDEFMPRKDMYERRSILLGE